MVPAKSRYLILRIIIMPPVISHADRIHMMYVRRPPADTAPPVPDALNQIGINVIRPHQTGFIHDNPLFQGIFQQCIDKFSCFRHGTIRQGKIFIVPCPHHVLYFHDSLDCIHRVSSILPDVPQRGIRFPLLQWCDAASILYANRHITDIPVPNYPGKPFIRRKFNHLLPRCRRTNPLHLRCKMFHTTTNTPSMYCFPYLPYKLQTPSSRKSDPLLPLSSGI